ncbi:MAG: RNA 2',3'-cyclic phosphodiesterase [Bacillota bacterium]|jgi:2'-5' RNA ligase
MRLFAAINFSEEVKDSLFECIMRLKKTALKGNFTHKENLHLTLVFIGETCKVEAVKSAIDCVSFAPFHLTIGGLGRFKRNGGDIYWIGVKQNSDLNNIYHQLRQELVKRDFNIENRPYKPHLTLGREVVFPKSFDETGKKELAASIPEMTMPVDSFSLMKSERIRGQLTYTEIYRKSL